MGGSAQHLLDAADLDHLGGIHDRHPVADLCHRPDVVGDQQDCDLLLVGEAPQDVEDLGLHQGVEGGRGLIRDDEAWPQHDAEADHDPLAHPSRELVGPLARPPGGYPERCQGLVAHAPRPGPGDPVAVGPDHLNELVLHPHQRVEAAHRLLEDQGHLLAPQLLELRGGHADGLRAGDAKLALLPRSLGQQTEDGPGERGLATARLSHEPQALARMHDQVDAVDRHQPPLGSPGRRVPHPEAAGLQHPLGVTHPAPPRSARPLAARWSPHAFPLRRGAVPAAAAAG